VTSVFWFRRDARLDDNPGLVAAVGEGPVVPLFVIDPALFDRVSEPRRDLLIAGLAALDAELAGRHHGRLRVEFGDPAEVVPRVAEESSAESVHVSEEFTPYGRRRDRLVGEKARLTTHPGVYVHPPGSVLTAAGESYRVFTPFHRSWSQLPIAPSALPSGATFTDAEGSGLPSVSRPIVDAGPGAAQRRLEGFLQRVDAYDDQHDRIDLDSTSHMSVDLKYGWIGPRRVAAEVGMNGPARAAFVRQLAWRDFYGHLMDVQPEMVDRAMDRRYDDLRWRDDAGEIAAWKAGRTGYPLVDAAMRRLVTEGQMHNRARLIVGSFLVKDLLVDWRVGERFFRHHLIDADTAQNSGNWQWVAGTGTDAAPYFRVFNPVTQSRRFDPDGLFIRSWVPELSDVPDRWVHAPWEAGPLELASFGVRLGEDYPEPIVDHAMARARALDAYDRARGSR
jgi:deoxyribodipyrimidine photo-lyase